MLTNARRALRPKLLACAATGALICATAASAGEDVTTVDELIITSQSLEQTLPLELSKYGNDIEMIDAEVISQLTYIDTADALRMQTPGFYLAPRNGAFSYNDISIQGSRTGDVLWLVDGVRINNRLYTSTSPADTLPSSMIERIEVLKGGQSLFYGTAAAGGVINVVTRAFSDEPGGELSIGADTNQGYHVSGYGRGASGPHQFVVYGSYDEANGYAPFTRFEPSATDRERGYDVRVLGAKYGLDLTDDLTVSLRYQHTDALIDYLAPTLVAEGSNERDEDIFSANIDYRPNDVFQLLVKAYLHDWDSYYTTLENTPGDPSAPPTVADSNTGWWFYDRGINLLAQFSPGGGFEYLAGYDYQTYEGQDDVLLIDRQTETVNALIAQVRTTDALFENARLAAGARRNDTGETTTTTWNASGRVDVTPNFYVEGTVGTAFVLPSAEQLFGIDPCCAAGNPNLEAEESRNFNLSVGGVFDAAMPFGWQLTWFDRQIDNLIDDDGVMYVNAPGEVNVEGWEAQLRASIGDSWFGQFSYTHADATMAGSTVQVPRIPEDFAKASLNYNPADRRWGGTVSALWTGDVSQNVNCAGSVREPYGDYVVVDLAAHYYLDDEERNRLTIRVENSLDEDYATRLGSATPDAGGGRFLYGFRGVPQTFHVTFTRSFGAQ